MANVFSVAPTGDAEPIAGGVVKSYSRNRVGPPRSFRTRTAFGKSGW